MNVLLNPWLIAALVIGIATIIATLRGVRMSVIAAMFALVVIIGMRGAPVAPPASTLHAAGLFLVLSLMVLALVKRKHRVEVGSHN